MSSVPDQLRHRLVVTKWSKLRQCFPADEVTIRGQIHELICGRGEVRRTAAQYLFDQGVFDGSLTEFGFHVLPFFLHVLAENAPDSEKSDVYEMFARMMVNTQPSESCRYLEVTLDDGSSCDLLTAFRLKILEHEYVFKRDCSSADTKVSVEAKVICEVLDEWKTELLS